jgi:predicted RNA-binding Zn-ribbon protein involved in translation (DUF1610 family)
MEETFKTLATFQYSSEAHIIKGKLESEGIQVFLFDDFTVDVDPLISNAIDGVKLKVLYEDIERAQVILKTISNYSLDDTGDRVVCPKCGENHIYFLSTIKDFKSLFWFLFGFIFTVLPFYTKYTYRCENCKTEFNS